MKCLDCGRPRAQWHTNSVTGRAQGGRGLCHSCYNRHARLDTLADFPRSTYSRDELLDEWTFLRSTGCDMEQAAARLGMAKASLKRALHRAKASGDERAIGFTKHSLSDRNSEKEAA